MEPPERPVRAFLCTSTGHFDVSFNPARSRSAPASPHASFLTASGLFLIHVLRKLSENTPIPFRWKVKATLSSHQPKREDKRKEQIDFTMLQMKKFVPVPLEPAPLLPQY